VLPGERPRESKKATLVLAVEEALLREGLASICEGTGRYRVAGQCGDGRTAARLIETLAPDAAILDAALPRLHTFALIRQCLVGGSPTKYMVLSSRADPRSVISALRSGASGFLLRSDTAEWLVRGLHDILAGSIWVSPQLKLVKVFQGRAAAVREAYEELSPREYQVFMMVVHGLRGKEIAARLDLSEKTVSTYRALMMRKIGVSDVPALVRYAVRKRLINLR
jgi:DNA-binding NarL/FixJ family response regulator